ncbi:MAG: DegT/DnrJ/EryC1/StrS aminotransferase [Elusimicrobia bacterium RIFOXYA2_FULL_58_8]|nr:MAG: DegT/DnrJ/EryC1/StrS aminotransferase [Elusimicrobia bacterium RIFOXYA12_FULL_57_11]OGS15461.1 MAG: DegT/DnrJ/EryC1/StrS aminotransferase [Elusimicrobia bacterium RIFOXYA2_FULL_58_8]
MIPLMKNTFLNEYETKKELVDFILKAKILSMGEKCLEFEKAFAKTQGRRHCILFNSGGSANLALLQALKNLGRLKDGDSVGFSALTWSTNVMPILQLGMKAVPVDCEAQTLNCMAVNLAETLKTVKLDAFFITNALGFAGDLGEIRKICAGNGVLLIEDNCESLCTALPGGRTGNFGLASTFSFFVAHHMSTIEGGCACTDDDELDEMLRITRANGWDRNLNFAAQRRLREKHGVKSEFEAKYTFYDLGFNLRPTEITGFLGLTQLKYLEANCDVRQKNYLALEEEVSNNPDLLPVKRGHLSFLSNFAFPVICKTRELRGKYIEHFSGAGVEIRPIIAGNMQRQPFFAKYVKGDWQLKGAQFLHECAFYFGNYPELTDADLDMLKSCLRKY